MESCILPRPKKDIKIITGSIIDDTALAGTFVRVFCPDNEADYEEMSCSPSGNWIGIAPSCDSELSVKNEDLSSQTPHNVCVTTDTNLPCMFPFRHENNVYNGCTTQHHPNKTLWCSTKVDQDGNHVSGGGHFGCCSYDCPIHVEELAIRTGQHKGETICRTNIITSNRDPAKIHTPCVFPFRFRGVNYNGCTRSHWEGYEHLEWCSTKTDQAGNHVAFQAEYGYCSNDCPTHGR